MFYWTDPGVGLVGASGSIMGIVGAYLVFFPRNDVTMAFWYIVGYETFSLPSWIMIVLWFGFDLFYLLNGAQTGVAYVAHVAGFSTGFVIACLLAWYEVLVPTRYEQTLLEVFGIH